MKTKLISADQTAYNRGVIRKMRKSQSADCVFMDMLNIGTKNYLGIAYFWHYEYRHWMRDLNCVERIKVHNAFLKAKLIVDECSDIHRQIIESMYFKFRGRY